eukprot:TRINITY_DN7269_c0_g1_i2.p1 TRINITY_DN7269_c0_g1~~TRINITY_DN7269_c0_g1_i2.p1  ORF type:complete len:136 (-),score=32.04 TRINITY_DN7269_c0_g1_i2:111-494(-)
MGDVHINLDDFLEDSNRVNLLSSRTGCSVEAEEILAGVNEHRRKNGLGALPTNNCLCQTADKHTKQLVAGQAWRLNWASCTHNGRGKCMWNKPKEICGYQGKGFENWAGYPEGYDAIMYPNQALNLW